MEEDEKVEVLDPEDLYNYDYDDVEGCFPVE